MKRRHGGRLPPYTDYLIRRCASLYLLLPGVNLYSAVEGRLVQVDNAVSLLAAHYILAHAAKIARSLFVEVSRVFSSTDVVESYDSAGYLDVVASMRNTLKFQPPVWRRVKRGPGPFEKLCICLILSRLVDISRKLVKSTNILYAYLESVYGIDIRRARPLRRLLHRTEKVGSSLAALALRTCGPLAALKQGHCSNVATLKVGRLNRYFNILANALSTLENMIKNNAITVDVKARGFGVEDNRRVHGATTLRMILERLYELYVLYIVLRALSRLGEIRSEDSTIFVEFGEGIRIFYNSRPKVGEKPLSRVALGESSQLDRNTLGRLAGIPDITLVVNDSVKVVIEVKHSYNLSYLSLARFKTMAYIHEYDADAGILVYPGSRGGSARKAPVSLLEEEYMSTYMVLERAEARGYVKVKLRGNASLYITPLRPAEDSESININVMYVILSEVLRDADGVS